MCKSCSNGCVLTIISGENETTVKGSFCPKGVAFAYRSFKDKYPAPFKNDSITIAEELCSQILKLWGVGFARINRGIQIQGSPERSLFRTVVTTCPGDKYILEEVDFLRVERRRKVSQCINGFVGAIPVIPYSEGLDGDVVQEFGGRYWMLHPYVEHVKINRENFWKEEWRGKAVGEIISLLQQTVAGEEEAFSVENYVNTIVGDIKKENREHSNSISSVYNLLKRELFPRLNLLPSAFCHGDAHPLNMLWSQESISALIDWEFCGTKPRIYDLALIIGCVGSEDPAALNGGFNRGLIAAVKSAEVITEPEWKLLPALVIALRFNWLSEWLRRNDEEMVSFELFYMNHLLNSYYPEYAEDA